MPKQLTRKKKVRLATVGAAVLGYLQAALSGDVDEVEQLAAELSRLGVEVKLSSKFQQP